MRMSLFIGDILGKGKGLRYLQLTIKRFNNTNNSNNNTHIWALVCTDRYKKLLTKQIWWNVKNYRLYVLPIVQVPGRERRLLETMQLAIGEFITDSSQDLPPSPKCEAVTANAMTGSLD